MVSDSYSSSRSLGRGGLVLPCVIVFFSGFFLMVIELVASRLVMGYIGQSLYTWTSVIGVILAGITLGNYVGGWLADRYESKRLAATMFFLAGLACLSTLWTVDLVGQATATWIGSEERQWAARIVAVVFGVFFLPGVILGAVSPAVAKWALEHGFATGGTVGTVYAWNNIGCIVGTFVTGFFLIAWYEIDTIIWIGSGGLLAVGLAFVPAMFLKPSVSYPPARPRSRDRDYGPRSGGGLLIPSLLVFTSGFCVMLVEFVASRLVSGHIGQSLYTWTSVIGVILAGISLGNYIGGALADVYDSKQLVGGMFLLASIVCLFILQTHQFVDSADSKWLFDLPWGARVLGTVFVAFFWPALALGTISPAVAKWALDQGYATGQTVGTIYAWNTAGSIAGTFATGFYLISTFYVSRLIAATSLVLVLIALGFVIVAGPWLGRIMCIGWLGFTAFVSLFVMMPADKFNETVLAVWPVDPASIEAEEGSDYRRELNRAKVDRLRFVSKLIARNEEINPWRGFNYANDFTYYDESNYYTIQVSEDDDDSNYLDDYELDEKGKRKTDSSGNPIRKNRVFRQLVLDALIHGYIDMSDLGYLHYEYEHLYASVSHRLLRAHKDKGEELRVLFLGGGSYTFPRYLTQFYPKIQCDVGEIDPKVTRTVQRSLGLNAAYHKHVYVISPETTAEDELNRLQDQEREAESLSFVGKAGKILSSFNGPERKGTVLLDEYENKIEQAGAHQDASFTEKTNLVLDLRANRGEANPIVTQAEQSKVQVIGPDDFDALLDKTSHENITTYHMDARQYIMQNPNIGKYDVIYGDAFNDFSVPAHLTTYEFNSQLAKLLKPDGLFMANIIDVWQVSKFMGAYRNTLGRVFKHVYLLNTGSDEPSDDRSTFVLICSQVPVDLKDLGQRSEDIKGLVGSVMVGDILAPVIRGGLRQLGSKFFFGDGSTARFKLPYAAHSVSVQVKAEKGKTKKGKYLKDSEYGLEDQGQTLVLKEPLDKSSAINVVMYSDREVVLTDQYCPVDNLLAEVVATRIDE